MLTRRGFPMFPFSQIGHSLTSLTNTLGRARLMSELAELSDAELTKRGLNRSDLAQQVYVGR